MAATLSRQRAAGAGREPILHSCLLLAAIRRDERIQYKSEECLVDDPCAQMLADGIQYGTRFILRGFDRKYIEQHKMEFQEQATAIRNDRKERPEQLIRCRWIDDQLQNMITKQQQKHVTWQMVNLGAGMCARPYRLDCLRKVRCFEVDRCQVIAYKNERLAQITPIAASIKRIAADITRLHDASHDLNILNDPTIPMHIKSRSYHASVPLRKTWHNLPLPHWAQTLIDAGFQAALPTVFIIEGVFMYLDRCQCEFVLYTVRRLMPQATLLFDFVNEAQSHSRLAHYRLFRFGLDAQPLRHWLEKQGFIIDDLRHVSKHDLSYGRYIREPYVEQNSKTGKECQLTSFVCRARAAPS